MNHPDATPRENRPDPELLREERPTDLLCAWGAPKAMPHSHCPHIDCPDCPGRCTEQG